jgi:hypothetical protein
MFMKIDLLSNAGREISRWRDSFRSRGRPPSTPASALPLRVDEDNSDWSRTEWATTEWAETSPDTLALSGPIDADPLDARA